MSPCRKCTGECCRYFGLQIDTPRRKSDFENIRWYLAHKKTAVFVEKRKWFLELFERCRYLTKDHKCKIYHKRPLLCKEHSHHNCEFHGEKEDHDLHFKSLEEFDRYLTDRFKKKR
ncbi:YkgJ family cysteine cluster protein [Candidatus Omnitrophota bacterium]